MPHVVMLCCGGSCVSNPGGPHNNVIGDVDLAMCSVPGSQACEFCNNRSPWVRTLWHRLLRNSDSPVEAKAVAEWPEGASVSLLHAYLSRPAEKRTPATVATAQSAAATSVSRSAPKGGVTGSVSEAGGSRVAHLSDDEAGEGRKALSELVQRRKVHCYTSDVYKA